MGHVLVSLGRGADVIVDCHTAGIVFPEVPDQAAASTHDVQLHEFRVVFVLPQPAHDAGHVLPGCVLNDSQILFSDISGAGPENLLNDFLIDGGPEASHELLPDRQHALVGSVLLGEALRGIGLAAHDGHDVHGAIRLLSE